MYYLPSSVLVPICGLVLGLIAGTRTSLEILSFTHPLGKQGEADGFRRRLAALTEEPALTALFLRLGQFAALALLTLASVDFAGRYLAVGRSAGRLVAAALFLGLSAGFPYALLSGLGLARAGAYLRVVSPLLQVLFCTSRPLLSTLVAALARIAPRAVGSLGFGLVPLEKKMSALGTEEDPLKEEQRLMTSILDFGDTKVREVMVPRIDMVAVDVNTDPKKALATIVEAGHSRIPVYDETVDRIVGIVYTKDLLSKVVSGESFRLDDIARDVFFVPESKKIDELLSEFKKRKKHIAIAVDEYGGTAGLVTLEDVLEELVGDIQDEFDREEELIKRVDDDQVLCNAKVRLDELSEYLGVEISGSADSLGGFLYEKIGRVPRVGEEVGDNGLVYRITRVQRQRIRKVMIRGLRSRERRS